MKTLQEVAAVGAVLVRQETATGSPARAVDLCADLLALGRDARYGTNLLGAMIGAAIVGLSLPACAEAVGRAPADAARRLDRQLGTLLGALRPFADSMGETYVESELLAHGALLGKRAEELAPDLRRRLPALTEEEAGLARAAWRSTRTTQDALEEALRLAPAARHSRVVELIGEEGTLFFPNPERCSKRDDRARAMVELLQLLSRARAFQLEQGRWPTLPELSPKCLFAVPVLAADGDALRLTDQTRPAGGDDGIPFLGLRAEPAKL
jgi:hypothetical protein